MVSGLQRVDDTLSLHSDMIFGNELSFKQSKTGRELQFEMHPEMRAALAGAIAKGGYLICNEGTGTRYNLKVFEDRFADIRARAAVTCPSLLGDDPTVRDPNLTGPLFASDMRRTGMVWMAQGGAGLLAICSVSGHMLETGLRILEYYFPRDKFMASLAINALDMKNEPTMDQLKAIATRGW